MRKYQVAIGQTFNRLTVIGNGPTPWKKVCLCVCGKTTSASVYDLHTGNHKSCGCLWKEVNAKLTRARLTTHGMSKTPTYNCWNAMRARCLVVSDANYASYGGRGIKVCEAWSLFSQFLTDMGKKPSGMSLDRIDVDGDYEPGNCRWATPKQQVDNRRITQFLTISGETKPLSTWAAEFGLKPNTIRYRVRSGWPMEKVLSPSKKATVTA